LSLGTSVLTLIYRQNTEIIPIEMQHEEVDMDDPLMDPVSLKKMHGMCIE